MDCEPEELQFLGIIGVYREALKLIVSWRRLFSQISISLIVPLSFLFLLHIHISHLLFSQMNRNEFAVEHTAAGSPSQTLHLHQLASERSAFLLFKSFYLVALLVFSLLSTAAVVYTVASAYTAKHDRLLSYRKVLSVVPKVWGRLALTFLFAFLILVAYNVFAIFILFLILFLIILIAGDYDASVVIILFLFLFVVAYLAGLVWISVVWHLASVVSVLEEACGLGAMQRSRNLLRGKMGIAVAVFVKINLLFIGIELLFQWVVVVGGESMAVKVGYAMVMLGLMSVIVLFALVMQTVLYFVCKSYHHESIDKSALADHLEVYLGEYLPLKAKDLQMEQVNV